MPQEDGLSISLIVLHQGNPDLLFSGGLMVRLALRRKPVARHIVGARANLQHRPV